MLNSRKRTREEDDVDWEPQLPNHKRPRALPFRTSPTTKHINLFSQSPRHTPNPLLTPALTPVESSEDEGERKNPFRTPKREKSEQLTTDTIIHIDEPMDSEMDVDSCQLAESLNPWRSVESAQPSPCTIAPKTIAYNPQEFNHGGRIPTPIYGHFQAMDKNMEIEMADSTPQTQQEIAHDQFLRRRRLPSPISEDEAMHTPDGMGEMLDRLDMSDDKSRPPKANKTWGGNHSKRKTALSMGYRADCEKCRLKVPGHYNHLIQA